MFDKPTNQQTSNDLFSTICNHSPLQTVITNRINFFHPKKKRKNNNFIQWVNLINKQKNKQTELMVADHSQHNKITTKTNLF